MNISLLKKKSILQVIRMTILLENPDDLIKLLEQDSFKLFQYFSDNKMKANHDNWHVLVNRNNRVTTNVSGFEMKNNECENLLGIKVDWEEKFENYLDDSFK